MKLICEKTLCTGCSACLNVCPKGAIKMVEEIPLGYIFPTIDQNFCIDCQLCAHVCPVNNPVKKNFPLEAYAVVSKNEDDLMSSASGGASSLIASYVLKQGGVVYGCVQNNFRDISHRRIDKEEDAFLLKGSKYVQSNINTIYKDVKKDLQNGLLVLFTGTPCQIGGLKSFLRKDHDNLILVDLVCHGISSQKLLKEDISNILKGYNKSTENFSVVFRQKKTERFYKKIWGNNIKYGLYIYDTVHKKHIHYHLKEQNFLGNNYITAFMAETILRENCYQCQYAKPQRGSDLTIADYWGLGKTKIQSNKGISLVLCNTEKSFKIIDGIKEYALIEKRPLEEALRGNGRLNNPSSKPAERTIFIENYLINTKQAYRLSLKRFKNKYKKKLFRNFCFFLLSQIKKALRVR